MKSSPTTLRLQVSDRMATSRLTGAATSSALASLFVDKKANAAEMMTVYQTLKTAVKSDFLYVNPRPKGISIFCVVASFMADFTKMPRVARLVLSYK